jgi:hypothetical protein
LNSARISRAPSTLTEEQLGAFTRDGFVRVPGFFDAAHTAEVTAWVDELTARPEEPGQHWVYHEPSLTDPARSLIQRVEKFADVDPRFAHLFCSGRLHSAVSELLGERAELFKEKINYKMPGGPGFRPHQDSQAGWGVYASYFVTALVAIDPCTLENGCLEIAAGEQRRELLTEEWKPLDDDTVARLDFRPVPAEPGDALFFDSFAPHQSGPNRTEHQRRVLYVTYNRASEHPQRVRYFADKHRSFPPDIEREPGKTYVFRV